MEVILNNESKCVSQESEYKNQVRAVTLYSPLVPQVGGNHYKDRGIQPVEYINANNLNFFQGNIVKYITRHKDKNGLEDLAKVIHYTLLESYFQYGVEGSTELKRRVLELLGE